MLLEVHMAAKKKMESVADLDVLISEQEAKIALATDGLKELLARREAAVGAEVVTLAGKAGLTVSDFLKVLAKK